MGDNCALLFSIQLAFAGGVLFHVCEGQKLQSCPSKQTNAPYDVGTMSDWIPPNKLWKSLAAGKFYTL